MIHDEVWACPLSLLTCLVEMRLLDLVFLPVGSAGLVLKTMS